MSTQPPTSYEDIESADVTEAGSMSTPTRPRANGGPHKMKSDYVIDSSPNRLSMNLNSADFFARSRMNASVVPPNEGPANPPSGTTGSGIDIAKPTETKLRQISSIEQAKDRAQITAATAMSIIQVALLKDVIDAGPAGNKYYYWSLGFIVTALILQVLAGFVALYIALLRYYYTEYKDDFADDALKSFCPWSCRRVKHAHSFKDWLNQPYNVKPRAKKKSHNNNTEITAVKDNCDSDSYVGCCGAYECTAMRFADFEYEVLDMYDNLEGEVIKANLQVANFENELKWLVDKETKLNSEVQKYEALNDANNNEYLEIKSQLKEVLERRADLEEKNRFAKELRAQKAILQHDVERIQEERVLKRVTFWQNWLNMMLYTVFILNAVIAGIGLANPQSEVIVLSPTGSIINRTATG